jgi:mannosyltransferase
MNKIVTNPIWRRVGAYGLLTVMVGFVIYFALAVFGQNSLRLDEAQSLFQTNRNVGGILYLVAQDVHVPLYHVILHFWSLFLGQDVLVARLMSLAFFVGTIIMTYVTATYAFGRRSVGLFAALLITLSPFMNWYGMEARMYTMLAFIATLHTYLFLKIMRSPSLTYWILWTLVAILGVYTHYFFIFVLLAEFFAVLLLRKQFTGLHPIRSIIIAGSVVALSLVPWLLYVLSLGFASNTQPALTEPSAGDLFDTYAQFIFGFQASSINTVIVSLWPIAVLLGFFALQRSNKNIPPATIVFVLLATLPVIAAFIISITIRPFYLSRYLIVALPPLLIFIAWLLTRYRRSVAVAIRIALVAVMGVLFVVQVINPNTPVKEDYREAVTYLNENAGITDVVILSAPFTIYPVEYYYTGPAKLTTQPIWDRFESGAVPGFDEATVAEETEQNVGSYQTAWLVLSYDQGYNENLKAHYDGHYEKLSERRFSPGLSIYEYKIRYDNPVRLNE